MCCRHPCGTAAVVTYGIITALLLITSLILIACSIQTVPAGHYGLLVDYVTMTPDLSDTYPPGRYFFGLGHDFLLFPSTLQTVEYLEELNDAITARTSEGLQIILDSIWQYKIDRAGIPSLWRNMSDNYDDIIRAVGRDIVRDVASNYAAIDFFQIRPEIADNIRSALTDTLSSFHVSAAGVYLESINLPDAYESALETNQIAYQDIFRATQERERESVLSQQWIMLADVQAVVVGINATATGIAMVTAANAAATGLNVTTTAFVRAASDLQANISLSAQQLVGYMYLSTLKAHAPSRTVFSADAPNNLVF